MSIEAIEEIEEYVRQREAGLNLAEIKRRCEEFIKKRDRFEQYNESRREVYRERRSVYSKPRVNFVIREGIRIERDRVKK
jgi:hypothetical protein